MLELLLALANIMSPLNPTRLIALTFDDGLGTRNGRRVLRVLNKHNVQATFFPKAARIKASTRLCSRHHVEVHGWHQGNTRQWGSGDLWQEIIAPVMLFEYRFKRSSQFFRPPGGQLLTAKQWNIMMKQWRVHLPFTTPLTQITWTFDSRDIDCWIKTQSVSVCEKQVRQRLRYLLNSQKDHVVLLHDSLPWTYRVVDDFLSYLSTKTKLVTLSEFYGRKIVGLVLHKVGTLLRRIIHAAKRELAS